MKRALLAAVVVFAASHAASAGTLLLPNGGFETNPAPVNGFTQTISNWTVSMSGTPDAALPSTEYSGLFTSFGKFSTAPQGNQFVLLTNLGGSGVVTLTSGGVGNNLFLSDRMIAFNFAYLSNDASGNFQHDKFSVHIDFFSTATSTTVINTLDQDFPTDTATFNDTNAGVSPFSSAANNATVTYNNATGTAFNFATVDVSAFFGSFARISFIVDNSGPTAGTNSNGLGVSGIVLDNVFLTPEPSAIALFAFGAAGLGGFAWRRRSAKKPA